MNNTPPPSTEELTSAMRQGWEPKWAFFWGHTPAKDVSVTKSCFSQWWDGHAFTISGTENLLTPAENIYQPATSAAALPAGIEL